MHSLIWSLVERVLPRAASALLMVMLAYFMSPFIVGLYAWPMLILTFYYSALDGAIRQIVVPSWKSATAFRLLQLYRKWATLLGFVAMVGTLVVLWIAFPTTVHIQIISLLPLVLVPAFNSWAIIPLGYLQKLDRWRLLAQLQVWSALTSLVVSLPALVLTHSLLGASLQVLLTEGIFAIGAQVCAARNGMNEARSELLDGATYGREFAHSSLFYISGWAQAQIDRILVGAFSGTLTLGSYNFALAIARNPGDAISASTSNVLRVRLSKHGRHAHPRALGNTADRLLYRGVALGGLLCLAIIAGAEFVLRPLLSVSWQSPLDAAVPATISIIPTILSWSLSVVMLSVNRIRWGTPIRVVGMFLGLPIAYAAISSLELAAWFVLAREVVMLLLFMLACGKAVPWRSCAAGLTICVCFSVIALIV